MEATKTKRAAPDRATRDAKTRNPNHSASSDKGQGTFVVLCMKSNGRRVPFQTYTTRVEAEAVAQQLRRVGCDAIVEARP